MIRVVLDTNVYLSGIIFGGNSRHILDLVLAKDLELVASPAILLEITQKLQKKFKWSKDQILLVVKSLGKVARMVNPEKRLNAIKADKSDNRIIEAAVGGKARFIVTGDKHLLQLKKYQKIQIVTPAQFLSIYL
jgi:uncharacterized protein